MILPASSLHKLMFPRQIPETHCIRPDYLRLAQPDKHGQGYMVDSGLSFFQMGINLVGNHVDEFDYNKSKFIIRRCCDAKSIEAFRYLSRCSAIYIAVSWQFTVAAVQVQTFCNSIAFSMFLAFTSVAPTTTPLRTGYATLFALLFSLLATSISLIVLPLTTCACPLAIYTGSASTDLGRIPS